MSSRIDLVVPTVNGREDSLDRCIESYQRTANTELNVIVVSESRTCGWGWKQGLAAAQLDYVALVCDDQESIAEGWDEKCIASVDRGVLPCPRVWKSTGELESNGGDMRMLNHVDNRAQPDGVEVDYTTVPFLSAAQAEEIGMLPVHYASDVWVSYRGRQLGYETRLVHGYDIVHHWEQHERGAGMSVPERDEMDCKTVFDELERLGVERAEAH